MLNWLKRKIKPTDEVKDALFDNMYTAMNEAQKEMSLPIPASVVAMSYFGMQASDPIHKDASIHHLAYVGLVASETLSLWAKAHADFTVAIEQAVVMTLNDDTTRIQKLLEAYHNYCNQIAAGADSIYRGIDDVLEPQRQAARRIYPNSKI